MPRHQRRGPEMLSNRHHCFLSGGGGATVNGSPGSGRWPCWTCTQYGRLCSRRPFRADLGLTCISALPNHLLPPPISHAVQPASASVRLVSLLRGSVARALSWSPPKDQLTEDTRDAAVWQVEPQAGHWAGRERRWARRSHRPQSCSRDSRLDVKPCVFSIPSFSLKATAERAHAAAQPALVSICACACSSPSIRAPSQRRRPIFVFSYSSSQV